MPESTVIDENLVAVWNVGGATYKELYENALKDAQDFMEGESSPWRFFVAYCQPKEFSGEGPNEQVTLWKGQGFIRFTGPEMN